MFFKVIENKFAVGNLIKRDRKNDDDLQKNFCQDIILLIVYLVDCNI